MLVLWTPSTLVKMKQSFFFMNVVLHFFCVRENPEITSLLKINVVLAYLVYTRSSKFEEVLSFFTVIFGIFFLFLSSSWLFLKINIFFLYIYMYVCVCVFKITYKTNQQIQTNTFTRTCIHTYTSSEGCDIDCNICDPYMGRGNGQEVL